MALQLAWTANETTYPNAYARIINVAVDPRYSWIVVGIYADEAARWAGADAVKLETFIAATPSLTGDIYTAAYEHLTTLPQFAGAVDVPAAPAADVPPVTEPEPPPAPADA